MADNRLCCIIQADIQCGYAAWSAQMEHWVPTVPDTRALFNDVHRKDAPDRDDIGTWFDWLELDDYVSYGGRP